ncbi:methionyl-tRNA synthetase [Neoconidiobolus thromboides FSU 785]|nr:methionyl-tRNA synthetase [Neoconidiobolus thromboides FSU 785]
MAKLPKIVVKKSTTDAEEWIKLFKIILACQLGNLKVQYFILEQDSEGITLPSIEFFKEKVSFFEPNAAVRYILKDSYTLDTKKDIEIISTIETESKELQSFVKGKTEAKELLEKIEKKIDSLVNQNKFSLFFKTLFFATLYPSVVNNNFTLESFSQLNTWFKEFSSSEAVKEAISLTNDLAAGKAPIVVSEVKEEVKSIIGDETMRKIKKDIAVAPKSNEPKLPIPGKRNVLVTSALPYVNNVPHLGNLIGSLLSADVFARYCRISGENYLYICGTDEYGTATETKALEEGVSCQELCDKYNKIHQEVYKHFEIDFDYFGRTTTEQQTVIAQDIFMKLHENGFTHQETVSQLYCEKCERFLADRYVEGTCPKCQYNDARGDQCDQCGTLLNASELIKPRCKLDSNSPVLRDSTHIFLDLPNLQTDCENFVNNSSEKGKWTTNGKTITKSWLKEGLKPRCITRDLKWGTPVPLEEMKNKVFYVWFDAPIGYLSITANYTKEWEKWWKNPEQVELFQFMGKDNVPFHTVIFPSALIGTKEDWTLLNHINTTEYLNYEDGKFSKSRNVGVFGNNVIETGIPVSVWRYYLLSNRPETNDSIFTWKEFITKNNSELLANLGNFCNRILKFVASAKYQSAIPAFSVDGSLEQGLISDVNKIVAQFHADMKLGKLRSGIKLLMEVSQLGNGYLQSVKIDNTLFNNHREQCDNAVGLAVNLVYLLASLMFPFMPSSSEQLCSQLNAPLGLLFDTFEPHTILPGHIIGQPQHLFTRIDEKMEQVYRSRYGGGSS